MKKLKEITIALVVGLGINQCGIELKQGDIRDKHIKNNGIAGRMCQLAPIVIQCRGLERGGEYYD